MIKKFSVFMFVFFLLISINTPSIANETAFKAVFKVDSVSVNIIKGTNVELDTLPLPIFIVNNRSILAAKFLSKHIGIKINYLYEPTTQNTDIELIDSNKNLLRLTINSKVAYYNSKMITIDVAPILKKIDGANEGLVPLRFVFETFGYTVEWNNDIREITVYK